MPQHSQGQPTVQHESSSQNLSKLEEVLKRQRERLENISGSFQQVETISANKDNHTMSDGTQARTNLTSKYEPRQSALSHSEAPGSSSHQQTTPLRGSHQAYPIPQHSALRESDGVYSTSTNNLEKAYDDLEREIREIKARLEGSTGPSPPMN